MKVVGLINVRSVPGTLASWASHLVSLLKEVPNREAISSMTAKPALCRVPS